MIELGPAWMRIIPSLTHVFQPIVRFADGSLFGFEALLRGWEEAGFRNLSEVFDRAWEDRELYALDLALRAKAFRRLAEARHARAKLFYNVDNRPLERPEYVLGTTPRLTAQAGLSASRIVFEVSEKHDPGDGSEFDGVLEFYKRRGFRVALDDFGSGYSGFKLLYRADPNYVKIDRYFIAGSAEDPRKATFLQKIVDMAHIMGIEVVAEGELMEARDQNPLTRLPGNLRITSVCSERLADPGEGVVFAYYDFDNFKPFNDRYGFRSGDRVIMLFADILRSMVKTPRDFVGHLGGDDFFACLEAPDAEGGFGRLVETARRFSRDVRSFYSAEDRERGWIIGKDESRTERPMGFLTVSAAAVHVGPGADMDAEELSDLFADLKRRAKLSPEGTAFLRRGPAPSRPSASGTSTEPEGTKVPVVRSRRESARSGTNPAGAI